MKQKLFERIGDNSFRIAAPQPISMIKEKSDETKITTSERNKISAAFAKVGLDGNGRFEKKEQGLAAVTSVLDQMGFQLDMVSGDMIMGDKGNRTFIFRRKNDPGQDPFSEKPEISNSRIAFVWENMGSSSPDASSRFEILAYAS